jgi:hypothetical protein
MFIYRLDSSLPYQTWNAFPPEAIVLVYNAYGDGTIDQAKNLWWGFEREFGKISEGVIVKAKRLDKPKKITGYKPGSVGHVSTSD